MIYNITCSTDDNYLQHCMAMLCSVFENNKEHEVHVHMMIDDKLSQKSRQLIEELATRYNNKAFFYDVDPKLVSEFDVSKANYNGIRRFPMIVYYRLLLQFYLSKEIDRILYLDCDVIVLSDLSDLFNLNLENYGLAAVKDSTPISSRHRRKMGLGLQHSAFCSGVMMINLNYWRENDAYKQFLEFFNHDKDFVYLPDQDVLNYVFRDKWIELSYKWGKTPFSTIVVDKSQKSFDIVEYAYQPTIIHYSSSEKPWMNIWLPYKKAYQHYLKLSNFNKPQVTRLKASLKTKIYIKIVRYITNKYIRPCVPDVFEVLLKDIMNIVRLAVSVIRGPKSYQDFCLRRLKDKYGI